MIKTEGIAEEIQKLRSVASAIDHELSIELNKAGLGIVRYARKNTPTKTGTLKRGFHFDGVEKDGDEYRIEVTNNTEYAAHVEYGHREYVWGRPTGRIRPGRYMLTTAEARARKFLPTRIKRALARVEAMFNE